MCFGGRPFSFPGPFPGGRGKEKALGMRMGEDMLGGSVTCIFEPWVYNRVDLQPIVLCDRFLYAMDTQHFILRNYSEWTVLMPYTRICVSFLWLFLRQVPGRQGAWELADRSVGEFDRREECSGGTHSRKWYSGSSSARRVRQWHHVLESQLITTWWRVCGINNRSEREIFCFREPTSRKHLNQISLLYLT